MIKLLKEMMQQLNETKKNNKGFTLVELIIVVAIIAVLATVLAPQYLQYVERSRESNDIQVAQNLIDAAVLAASDPANNIPSDEVITVVWNDGTADADSSVALEITATDSTTDVTKYEEAIIAVVGTKLGTAQSQNGTTSNLSFTIDIDTGKVTVDGNWNGLLN